MTALRQVLGVLFPILSGRIDAAQRIAGLEVANVLLVRENARLRQKVGRYEQHRRAARARLTAAVRGGGR